MGSIKYTDARFYSNFPLQWSDGPIKVLGIDIYSSWHETLENNFDNILQKAKNTLNSWHHRSLTPIGKIQVVNTLTTSKFLYKLQVLPSPGAAFEIKYKRLITEFIWDKKRPKISYKRLIAAYSNGGQQLRDLLLINKSFKLAKIQDLRDQGCTQMWKHYFLSLIELEPEYGGSMEQ